MLAPDPDGGGGPTAAVEGGRFGFGSMVPPVSCLFCFGLVAAAGCVCEGYTTKRAISGTYKGIGTDIWRQISIGESVPNSPVPCFFFLVSEFNVGLPAFLEMEEQRDGEERCVSLSPMLCGSAVLTRSEGSATTRSQ